MLTYDKAFWGLLLIFRIEGSPFPRTLPFALLSLTITILLHTVDTARQHLKAGLDHHYPYQTFAFVLGFLVVLRTNHAIQRFMEAGLLSKPAIVANIITNSCFAWIGGIVLHVNGGDVPEVVGALVGGSWCSAANVE